MKTNVNRVYAAYRSGEYVAFYETEEEAQKHCENNYDDFNGQRYQQRLARFSKGELAVIDSSGTVFVTSSIGVFMGNDGITHIDNLKFVNWE